MKIMEQVLHIGHLLCRPWIIRIAPRRSYCSVAWLPIHSHNLHLCCVDGKECHLKPLLFYALSVHLQGYDSLHLESDGYRPE